MNKPLPTPPTMYDLVDSFDGLALAGKNPVEKKLPEPPISPTVYDLVERLDTLAVVDKKPVGRKLPESSASSSVYGLVKRLGALALAGKPIGKRLPEPPAPITQPDYQNTFIGGFSPELLALNAATDRQRRQPLVPPPSAANQNARAAAPQDAKAPSVPLKQVPMHRPMPVPRSGKQSLTVRYPLGSLRPNTQEKLAPPFVVVRPPRRSDLAVSLEQPAPIGVIRASQPALDLTSIGPRSVPCPPLRGNTTQCNGATKAGKQCSRQVKLPATHFHLDPTPVLYCHQHRTKPMTQTGFYVRNTDRFVEFSHYIPKYLQKDTQLALRVEMEKATSPADVPGYIYTFEIQDSKRPGVIQLKVGRAVNLTKRLDQWDKQCGSQIQILRGWWPGTVENDNGIGVSLLRGNIKAGDPGPFCHRVERLVHIELADLSLHAPYLNPNWPNNTSSPTTNSPNPKSTAEVTCPDCRVVHREIFTFPRPEEGKYKGKEWDLIVKPVIEKWGRFVKEYY